MEINQKHMCKFCYKSFPCGRSLGGHMRSHLINISPSEKKLPPLTTAKNNPRNDVFVETGGDQFGYVLRENPKKTRKSSKEDTLLVEKLCKECGKTFQSWKALFGHMKCHSLVGKAANSVEEDSWNSSSENQKQNMNKSSDNEAANPLCKRKRSDRVKRYTNFSPCLSEIDQQEQEEVALSLIMLSMDFGCMNSVVESTGTSSELFEAKKTAKTSDNDAKTSRGECLKFKKLRNGKLESEYRTPDAPRKKLKRVSADEFRAGDKNLHSGCNESEVSSPKSLIKKNGLNQFGPGHNKNKKSKSKCIDPHDFESNPFVDCKSAYGPSDIAEFSKDIEKKIEFRCTICRKVFPSYQALGGHRASHKKFKGCCAPTSETSLETENSPIQGRNQVEEKIDRGVEWKRNKEHECPICFKVFPSGQALGGHKRSHFTSDQSKSSADPSVCNEKPIREIRDFLDLNLPAPVEEEYNEFKWWMESSSNNHQHEPLLGLLSS